MKNAGLEERWAAEEEQEYVSENNLDQTETIPVKFFAEQCVDELSVSKCMREQRLLVDLRKMPEMYLQITAISIGIPQIVRTKTEFVEHGRNGIVINKIEELTEPLEYYLKGLQGWNQARVCSYELVKEYTTERLLEKWGKVMDRVGGNSHLTAGRRRLE